MSDAADFAGRPGREQVMRVRWVAVAVWAVLGLAGAAVLAAGLWSVAHF